MTSKTKIHQLFILAKNAVYFLIIYCGLQQYIFDNFYFDTWIFILHNLIFLSSN